MAETPLSPDSTPGESAACNAPDLVDVPDLVPAPDLIAAPDSTGLSQAAIAEIESADAALGGESTALVPDSAAAALGDAVADIPAARATPADASAGLAPQPSSPETPAPTAEAELTANTFLATALASPEAMAAPQESAAVAPWSPTAAAAPVATVPAGIAATIAVPPLEGAARGREGEGGEWELLVDKLNSWFGSGELNRQWQKIRGPLKGGAILIGVILTLWLYASIVSSIDRIPVVSGLLELIGLISLGRFGLTKMVRRGDREQVLANWNQRWQAFCGQD